MKEKGLQDQLLGIVVRMEEPKLETDKAELVRTVAAAKRKLVELESHILNLLKNVSRTCTTRTRTRGAMDRGSGALAHSAFDHCLSLRSFSGRWREQRYLFSRGRFGFDQRIAVIQDHE